MAATYSGNPSSSDSDKVRFLLGDTDMTDPKFQDPEIAFLLTEWNDPYLAASEGAQQLANTAASWMTYTADGNSLTLDQLQAKYSLMADQLRAQYNRQNRVAPWNAQADVGEWDAYEADESIVSANFGLGITDNQWTTSTYGGATQEDLRGGPW